MDDFLFLPERYAGYPLSIAEARERLTRERYSLLNWQLLSKRDKDEAWELSKSYLWHKLASSGIHSFTQSPENGAWYRIPPGYWVDHRSGLDSAIRAAFGNELSEVVEPRPYLQSIPTELIGQPIVLWREDIDQHITQMPETAEIFITLIETVASNVGQQAFEDTPSIRSTKETPLIDGLPVQLTAEEREAECKKVACLLDTDGVAKRDVRVAHVKERWDTSKGKCAAVTAITALMAGKPKGRQPRD